MIYAVAYCRVSSKDQKDEGVSLEVQKDICTEYAVEKGITIVKKWVVDEPASKPGRKHFRMMLDYAEKNKIEHLLVVDSDRLHRNKVDESTIDTLVDNRKLSVHIIGENKIYSADASGVEILLKDVKGAIDRYEVARMVERTQKGIKKKLESGIYPGLAPLGYINIQGDKERPSRIKQTSDAPIVKEFLEIFGKGNRSPVEMIEVARKLGLKSKQNNPLQLPSIKYMLKNKFYCGEWEFQGHSGKANGQWEPIVSKRTMLRNIELLKRYTLKYKKSRGKNFRFKGLIWCGVCGGTFFVEAVENEYVSKKTGKKKVYKGIYYHCSKGYYTSKGRREKCKMPFFPEELIEREILRNISYLKFDKEIWKRMRKSLFEMDAVGVIKAELKSLRSEQTQNETKQDRLYENWQADKITERFFKDRFDKLEQRQQEIKDRIEELEVEKELWNENVGKIVDMIDSLRNFKEKFQKANNTTKQYMVRLMTKRVLACAYTGDNKRVDKKLSKTLEFEWNDEFQALFEMGIIKAVDEQAKEWTKKYGPKPLSSKTFSSRKKPVDLSSLARQIKNSVITVGKSPNMGELHSLLNGESR